MQVSLSKRTILPTVFENEKGTYFSTTLFSPVRYNLTMGQGMMPQEQIKAVLKECAENAQEVEVEFMESQTKFGPQMQIYSVKPLPKKAAA